MLRDFGLWDVSSVVYVDMSIDQLPSTSVLRDQKSQVYGLPIGMGDSMQP